eukprot:c1695_g1_i1.p1 GENE.c1695_g1_i1~~c1695_g1_i1.p1  ORF type:complete len:504 (-),score=103.03 c1695_g1_i1:198-1709(-)
MEDDAQSSSTSKSVRRSFRLWWSHVRRSPQSFTSVCISGVGLIFVASSLSFAAHTPIANTIGGVRAVMAINILTCLAIYLRLLRSLVLTYVFMPAQLIGMAPTSAATLARLRDWFLARNRNASRVAITGVAGALDAIQILSPTHSTTPAENRKWLILLCANGTFMEQQLDVAGRLSAVLGSGALAFNYRGVGQSRGKVEYVRDLTSDGVAAMQYLLSQHGARPENVMLLGHSIGGAAAVVVRAMLPGGPILVDRSFANLADVVRQKLRIKPFGAVVSIIVLVPAAVIVLIILQLSGVVLRPCGMGALQVGLIICCFLGLADRMDSLHPTIRDHLNLVCVLVLLLSSAVMTLGYFPKSGVLGQWLLVVEVVASTIFISVGLGWSGVVAPIGGGLLRLIGWHLDVRGDWLKCSPTKRAVIYHAGDQMIPYASSLHAFSVTSRTPTSPRSMANIVSGAASGSGAQTGDWDLQLCGGGNAHMYALDRIPAEWDTVVGLAVQMFQAAT